MSKGPPTHFDSRGGVVAPWWHTAALVALILLVALAGTLLQALGPHDAAETGSQLAPNSPTARILGQYFPLLLVNWGLTLYVSRLFLPRWTLPELLGRHWHGARQVAVDLALASAVFAFVELFEALAVHALATRRNAALAALLPSTEAERLTWLLVAVSVGFGEEVVYRGYLQRQLAAFTGRASIGIVLSAVLFGIAHAEQGYGSAARAALYGLALGVLARARRSLLPGIVCHVAIDLVSGLAR
ncbi:MAG: CPBP family intramembrane glutamic endopeptidase [Polyangiaceae bacterium]